MSNPLASLTEGDVVAINKPIGISSHDVIYRVRKATGIKRVGHAGTLDPLATGVLIVLVGRSATKRQREFMAQEKKYEAEITFGAISSTMDSEGEMETTATPSKLADMSGSAIEAVLPQFEGDIMQKPPAYSAIKVGGEALYKKARRGEISNADIPAREVTIDRIRLTNFTAATETAPPIAHISIECQKGVYIRSLCYDIGQKLNVGAYMSGLVRTAVGDYTLEKTIHIEPV